ncbi:hypothetical protein NCAS_0A11510 [Naumovozyma castellii]|uniref:DUF1746 domain-containing protein n=1 Tax=Naumovozyma castellii TaxID=27288 RepID=G0V8B1_NAUCA|nr:hypothetical protein NCAS_0A11510 [Naumovozyma castellii CBS 4309]CCC67709.1 hypothetical protein NCAS_0A11510 [Naumovozyma castellii CBS 4309]
MNSNTEVAIFSPNSRASKAERNKASYLLRKKHFQRQLAHQFYALGCILIVIQYVKYGTTIVALVVRALVMALLFTPFPDDSQLRQMVHTSNVSGFISSRFTSGNETDNENTGDNQGEGQNNMPGAFPGSGLDATVSEFMEEAEVQTLKLKIRKMIFHSSFTLNLIFIIFTIIYPTDYLSAVSNGSKLDEEDLKNIASPFNNGNGVIQGERHGSGIYLQMIGQSLPRTNFSGNLGSILFDFLILLVQFSLFTLTCVNFTNLDKQAPIQDQREEISDGFDGNVFLTNIDLNFSLTCLLSPTEEDVEEPFGEV